MIIVGIVLAVIGVLLIGLGLYMMFRTPQSALPEYTPRHYRKGMFDE